jgi:hypothetical protein
MSRSDVVMVAVVFQPTDPMPPAPFLRRVATVECSPQKRMVPGDSLADYGRPHPLSENGAPRVTFYQWCRNWLDPALAKFAKPRP